MKKTQKKLGNKGFSLVELIVVIAIMAVLVGVLAPTLIKNIEKSRKSKDEQNLDTVKGAITTVLADEKYYDLLSDNVVTITGPDGTITITSDSDTKPDGATNTLKQELTEIISKEKVPMTSKDLKSKTIKFTITNGKVSDYNAS